MSGKTDGWLRVGRIRQAIAGLPDDALVEIEVDDGEDVPGFWPATSAYQQASDAAVVCGSDPQTEPTVGVLVITHHHKETRP